MLPIPDLKTVLAGGVAVALLVGGLYARDYMREHEQLKRDNVLLHKSLDEAEATISLLKDSYNRALNAAEAERLRAKAAAKATETIKEEARNAPESDDGPVAPVLGNVLDSLRSKGKDSN